MKAVGGVIEIAENVAWRQIYQSIDMDGNIYQTKCIDDCKRHLSDTTIL
jgi:hypothetical protein